MADVEKVIKGIECCLRRDELNCIENCPYYTVEGHNAHGCWIPLNRDALALLKAQQPRVLTVDDVAAWVRQKPLDREPIYVEVKDLLGAWGAWMVDEIASYLPETDLSGELYGKTWRCWSVRPTDEQRKAVKWNDAE